MLDKITSYIIVKNISRRSVSVSCYLYIYIYIYIYIDDLATILKFLLNDILDLNWETNRNVRDILIQKLKI